MSPEEASAAVRQLLAEGKEFRYSAELGEEASLVESGVADSFEMINLVLRLEQRFGIRFDPDEVNLANLESVGRIARFLSRRLAGPIVDS